MIFTGDNNNLRVLDFVNKPMFIGDTAGPVSGKTVFKRFGFANSVKGVAHYVVNQRCYFIKSICIYSASIYAKHLKT